MSSSAEAGGAKASAGNKNDATDEQIKQIFEELETLSGDALRKRYAEFAKQYPRVLMGGKPADEIDPEETEPPIPPMEVPKEGRVKNWGANTNSSAWEVSPTRSKKWGNFKVVDDKGVNVADMFTTEANTQYFIEYYQKTHAVPTDNPGTKPEPEEEEPVTGQPEEPGVPEEEPEPPATQPTGFPIPQGITTIGDVSTAFKHWGRHTTNYASGGSGPSERWDNKELQALNFVAGLEFNLGTKNGKRGSDNIDIKKRGNGHSNGKGGWYLSYLEWEEDGSDGSAGEGKEYPHPSTSHLSFNVQGKGVKLKNIKDGNWHAMLSMIYNDANGVPTMKTYYNEKATGKAEDYVLVGISKDTGNMKPGPALTQIAQKGGGNQSIQLRADEVPDAQIRNAFAIEIKPPAE